MRKMFLDELPTNHRGIDWNKCIDLDVYGIYKNGMLKIKYLNNDIFNMHTNSFKKCKFGKILKKHTGEFKYEVGQIIKDDKRDLLIVDKEYRINKNNNNKKWYRYKCNKCGWMEGCIEENSLRFGGSCSCCCNRTTVLGINTIWDKARWMCDLGVSEEDAKAYTKSADKKVEVICPDCGKMKKMQIPTVYNRKSISCTCGDGKTYSEKFMTNVLNQLKVDFIKEYSPHWTKLKDRRYDFYIPSLNMIIETHGMQHYEEQSKYSKFKRTLEEEQENDKLKRELALANGIEYYIEVDCRKSDLDWVTCNIYKQLKNYFYMGNIDFGEAESFALKNIVKEVCGYWNNKEERETTKDLAFKFNLDRSTITKYLKRGAKLGWCNYNSKIEYDKGILKLTKIKSKKIEIFKDGISLGIFESASKLDRQSEELFGIKLNINGILRACNGETKQYKGYVFKYVIDSEIDGDMIKESKYINDNLL